MKIMEALARYVAAVVEDGDYVNDWLTHMPAWLQGYVMPAGYWLSRLVELVHSVLEVIT